jgi:predicted NAD-dependent protein-ADP-ribosyltransferase YbiA (DUF1768 family)
VKPFTLLIERHRTEQARVVVMAASRDEAERLGRERAERDDVIWEEGDRSVSVEAHRG